MSNDYNMIILFVNVNIINIYKQNNVNDVNVPISQFKLNNRKYLHDHSLVIVYPK